MSTAGKVLTVLILLVMLVWVVMLSGVSQLNANYGQKIKREEQQLADVTKEAEEANTAYLTTNEKARLEQDLTSSEIRDKVGDIAKRERRLSTTIEAQTRLALQLQSCLKDAEQAATNLKNREAEKVMDEELLAKKRDEIDKLKAQNAEAKTQLAQLQEQFKKLLAENTAKVKAPATTPASSIRGRPSPSL